MTTVNPVHADIPAQLVEASTSGAALVGVSLEDSPLAIVTAINEHARTTRDAEVILDDDSIVALGALLGGQFIREFGWTWNELDYGDDNTAFAVLNEDHSSGTPPLNWVYSTYKNGYEINFLLAFNMVAAGSLPPGTPGDPAMFS